MMQIVIDIDEEIYTLLMTKREARTSDVNKVYFAIANGTPLPEHHGDLIDRNEINIPYDICDGEEAMEFVHDAPTIIEGSDSE